MLLTPGSGRSLGASYEPSAATGCAAVVTADCSQLIARPRSPDARQRDPRGECARHKHLAQPQHQRVDADVEDNKHHHLEGAGGACKQEVKQRLTSAACRQDSTRMHAGAVLPHGPTVFVARATQVRPSFTLAPCQSCMHPPPFEGLCVQVVQ